MQIKIALAQPPIPATLSDISAFREELARKIVALENAAASSASPLAEIGTVNFYTCYHGLNDIAIQRDLARLYLAKYPMLSWSPTPSPRTETPTRIKVGIVSTNMCHHTIGGLYGGIVEHLDRRRFQVIMLRPTGKEDTHSRQIDAAADQVVAIGKDLSTAREIIAAQKPDILFYPDIGMNPFTYFLAFHRLAPVQCTTLGHPVTTGIPNIDFFVSSTALETDRAQEHYTEKLHLMERIPCFYRRPILPEKTVTRADYSLPEEGNIYLCPQSLFKFHPDFDLAIREILHRDPDAWLVLIASKEPYWVELLQARWSKLADFRANRVIFLPRLEEQRFIALFTLADVVLDTFHFAGGKTSAEAIMLGAPLVTLPGAFLRSRITLACYRLIGVMDLVAGNSGEYVDLALRLARDRQWRKKIISRINDNAHKITEDMQAVREFEDFFASAITKSSRTDKAEQAALYLANARKFHLAGQLDQALDWYRKLLRCEPENSAALCDMGLALQARGSLEEAIACYQKAIGVNENFAVAHNNLGSAAKESGQLELAEKSYKTAIALQPDFAAAHSNLGSLLYGRDELDAAIACYEKAIACQPDYADAIINLGSTLELQGRHEEAEYRYQQALTLKPSLALKLKIAMAQPPIQPSTAAIHGFRKRLEAQLEKLQAEPPSFADPFESVGLVNFYSAYHGMNDLALQKNLAGLYLDKFPLLNWQSPYLTEPRTDGSKIKVGFFSSHLYNHTIGHLTRGIIEHLDRKRFFVVLLQPTNKTDAVTKQLQQAADLVVAIPQKLVQARQVIAEQRLDILFYPDIGMCPFTYFMAFHRLAPVQCVTWGHPVTTGIPNIDYFFSAESLESPDARGHYSEELFLSKRLPTYYYPPEIVDRPITRADFDLPDDANIYLCPQTLFKIHPDFDAAIMELLRRDFQARVVFVAAKHPRWTAMLQERWREISPELTERIIFLPRMPEQKFVSLLSQADVVIDTFHFSGGKTTAEALGLGVPVVTMPGSYMRSRVTAACYKLMGMDDLVAKSRAEYIDMALRLTSDRKWREEMVGSIREKSRHLFHDRQAVREFELFFTQAVAKIGKGAYPI